MKVLEIFTAAESARVFGPSSICRNRNTHTPSNMSKSPTAFVVNLTTLLLHTHEIRRLANFLLSLLLSCLLLPLLLLPSTHPLLFCLRGNASVCVCIRVSFMDFLRSMDNEGRQMFSAKNPPVRNGLY